MDSFMRLLSICGVMALVLPSLADAYKNTQLSSLVIKTSDCEDCGMGFGGIISVQVCGNGSKTCCMAHNLDHPFLNDFEMGTTNKFQSNYLGECGDFDLGDNPDMKQLVTIHHSGLDSVKFDFVNLELGFPTEKIYQCEFTSMLEGNSYAVGKNCRELLSV